MEESILYQVKKLSNLVARKTSQALAEVPEETPTGMQGFVLSFLGNNRDKDIFQRDVEKEFQIRPPTATGIIKSLEKSGYVERRTVDYDARLKKL